MVFIEIVLVNQNYELIWYTQYTESIEISTYLLCTIDKQPP